MAACIHLFGASGSGVTTLGVALADALGAPHLDTDDYYWLPTDPPFTRKREIPERIRLIERDAGAAPRWVLSGSLCSWGDPLLHRFGLVVFLRLPAELRMARLAAREQRLFGARIEPGGDMHDEHLAFLEWARSYETARAPTRSLDMHERWLERLECPVLRLDSSRPVAELVAAVQARLASVG